MQTTANTMSIEAVRRMIERWLVDEEFKCTRAKDRDSYFSYKATSEGLPLTILQPLNKADSIMIVGDASLSDDSKGKFSKIPEKEKRFMLFDFRMALLSTECHWQLIPPTESWKTIRVWKEIFYDGLSKDRFYEAFNAVSRALAMVTLIFQWKFDVTLYVS